MLLPQKIRSLYRFSLELVQKAKKLLRKKRYENKVGYYFNPFLQPVSPMRMFALVNLMRTLETNLFRLDRLWDVAEGNLNCVINHKNANIRRYGMDCFSKLCVSGLGPRPPDPKNEEEKSI